MINDLLSLIFTLVNRIIYQIVDHVFHQMEDFWGWVLDLIPPDYFYRAWGVLMAFATNWGIVKFFFPFNYLIQWIFIIISVAMFCDVARMIKKYSFF